MGERKEVERLRRERDDARKRFYRVCESNIIPKDGRCPICGSVFAESQWKDALARTRVDLLTAEDRVKALEGALREMRDRMTTSCDDLVMIDKVLGGGE